MITIPAGVRVLLATQPVDFRKGAHGLAALVFKVLGEDPFSGVVVVFRCKRADRIKILVWDASGLVLIWKAPSTWRLAGLRDAVELGRRAG